MSYRGISKSICSKTVKLIFWFPIAYEVNTCVVAMQETGQYSMEYGFLISLHHINGYFKSIRNHATRGRILVVIAQWHEKKKPNLKGIST